MTIEGNTGVTFTDNFNPFDSSSFAEQLSVRSLVNEPLFEFDTLKSNTQYPWLATKYSFANGGKTITFDLRKNVKWSDGTPFTSADVAYTFDLLNKVPATDNYGAPPWPVRPPRRTSTRWCCTTRTPEYLNITTIAGAVLIVNKAAVVQDQEPRDGGRDQGNRYWSLRAEQLLVPVGQVHGEPALLGWQARRARRERCRTTRPTRRRQRRSPTVSSPGPVTTLPT